MAGSPACGTRRSSLPPGGTAHMVGIATESGICVWQPKALGNPLPALGSGRP